MSDHLLTPADDRREGRRRAVDGLLRTSFGVQASTAGARALERLRVEAQRPTPISERIGTAQIRAVTQRASGTHSGTGSRSGSNGSSGTGSRSGTGSHRRSGRGTAVRERRMWWAQGALAAATVVAVLAVLTVAARSSPSDDLRVVAVTGTAVIGHGDQHVAARDGMVITRGDVLAIGVNSELRLLWNDGTLVVCGADSRVQIEREGAGKRLHLISGRIDAEVAPQPPEALMQVRSNDVEITVVGTRWSCVYRDDGTQVAVARGRVAVRRLSDAATIDLAAGQEVAVGPRGPLLATTTPVVAATGTTPVGTGLFGQYYDDVNLTQPVFSRIDRDLYFDFGRDSSPDPRIAQSTYSIRWTGELQPKVSGRHVITCQVDDGVRLRLGGNLLMEDWRVYEPRWIRAEVDLDAGLRYPLEVEYYQNKERAIIQLWWQAKGMPQEVIPTSQLFPIRPLGAIDG